MIEHDARRLERAGLEQVLDAAAAEEAHDQVGGIRLAPVVVERHDVRVLEPGDDLRLVLEPPDEVRVVGELGMDGLDRDLPPDLRLDRPVDDAERALADLIEQPIAAERLALQIEVRVLPEDALVQPSEVGRGVDAELTGQVVAGAFERRQRVRRTPGRGTARA